MTYKFVDELLDLVDEHDHVIRQEWRSVIQDKKLKYIRGVAGFLKNARGQLWIPRRCAEKPILPLALDMSVSGHVGAGESYEQAFIRELEEEIGLKADKIAYHFLGKLSPIKDKTCCFVSVFEIPFDGEPTYSSKDFCQASWLYPHEILEQITRGEKSKSGLPIMIQHFYKMG